LDHEAHAVVNAAREAQALTLSSSEPITPRPEKRSCDVSQSLLRAEDERTRHLSDGERVYFREFPFHPCFGAPHAWHGTLIPLHDYVVALSQLSLQNNDLILDFGSGPGWVTEFAARHGLRAVGIDCSEGTLRISRERIAAAGLQERAHFVKADGQRLPFRDGSFQAVVCLASLHHVEAMGAAVREMARLLRPDGEAILIEPGEGHAQKEHSRQAVESHGTLEQDVVAEDVERWAREAGFAEFHVVPQYFAFPAMRWTPEAWREHRVVAKRRQPAPELSNARRLFRLFKAWWQGRDWLGDLRRQLPPEYILQLHVDQWMFDHGCYLLRKTHGPRLWGSLWGDGLGATVEILDHRLDGGLAQLRVRLTNTGQALWLARAWREHGQVKLGLKRINPATGEIENRRFVLPRDVSPGETVEMQLELAREDSAGALALEVDLVSEQVKWFQAKTPGGDPARAVLGG
jgi:ubiquinone/menaquinone biosynthesis C-methylase UbiE